MVPASTPVANDINSIVLGMGQILQYEENEKE
jgi:hypothetical protein